MSLADAKPARPNVARAAESATSRAAIEASSVVTLGPRRSAPRPAVACHEALGQITHAAAAATGSIDSSRG